MLFASEPAGVFFLLPLAVLLHLIAWQLKVIRSQYELILDSGGIWLLSKGKLKRFCSWEWMRSVSSHSPGRDWLTGKTLEIRGISPAGAKLQIKANTNYWRESDLKQLLRILASYAEKYKFKIWDGLRWLN